MNDLGYSVLASIKSVKMAIYISVSKFLVLTGGDIIDYSIEYSGTTALCKSRLYPPVRD
jgi:hypothetical protein